MIKGRQCYSAPAPYGRLVRSTLDDWSPFPSREDAVGMTIDQLDTMEDKHQFGMAATCQPVSAG